MLHALWSLARRGWAWRWLPHDCPPWPVVDQDVRVWRDAGPWPHLHDRLRGRSGWPLAHGDDTPQHVKGRHRHLCVETFGWLRVVVVPAARRARPRWRPPEVGRPPRPVFPTAADLGRRRPRPATSALGCGRDAPAHRALGHGQTTRRGQGHPAAGKRWRVERTVGWCSRDRRCSTDADDVPHTSEAMIRVAMIHLMGRRLARLTCF